MEPADLLAVPPVWRALVSELHGGRIPDGTPGLRDADAPCEMYEPVPAPEAYAPGTGDCETDGHWLCTECVRISERALRHMRDLCGDCGTKLVRSTDGRHVSRDVECCPACDPEHAYVEAR